MKKQQNATNVNKCSVCENEFEDKYFNTNQQKCILHCEKDDWYKIENGRKDWSKSSDKIELFWQQVRTIIENKLEDDYYKQGGSLDFSKTIFPKFEDPHAEKGQPYDESINVIDWHDNFCNMLIAQSSNHLLQLDAKLNFSNSIFLDDIDFNDYDFRQYVNFNGVKFKGKCSFDNTTFKNVSFNNVNFFKSVIFKKAKVNLYPDNAGDFSNSTFHSEIEFHDTTFGRENNEKVFDIDFKGTKFKNLHFLSCISQHGLRFCKDTKMDDLDIQNMNLSELYIAGDIKNIYIRGNNKKIDKLTIKHQNLENLLIHNCIVGGDFLLNDKRWKKDENFRINTLNLKASTFLGKVKIQFYEIIGEANFYNTKFKDLADFYQTKFNEVNFERTDFEQIAVLSEAEFNCDVNFKYAKFLGKSIFRDTVIKGKLNLRDTIFDGEANFLDIASESRKDEKGEFHGEPKVIKVANRETARIIKNFYDKSNNIIEANKFYALEMEERSKEISFRNNFFEWIVFFLHGISSNHSQSWGLALYWMFTLSMLYTYEINGIHLMTLFVGFVTIAILVEYYFKKYALFIKYSENLFALLFAILISVYVYFNSGTWLKLVSTTFYSDVVKNMYIFSNLNSENITLGSLLYKVILSYLMYQFIVSVRQNTRRK